jgi:hypothetical protein
MHKTLSIFSHTNMRTRSVCVSLFFIFLIMLGVNIYQDYGISWDEPISRRNGMVTLNHLGDRFTPSLVANDQQLKQYRIPLDQYPDRDYGVAFELPVVFLERIFELNDTRDIYMFRHLLTFLTCICGIFAIFRLVERRFSDWRLGLLAASWLILSPRLFAESFYNDKDLVFMALFAIAMDSMVEFILRPKIKTAVIYGVFTAIAINIRIMAVILPIITLFILFLRGVKYELTWRKILPQTVLYIGTTMALVIAMWPWLWSAPWQNFILAFQNMSNFRWNAPVLYLGNRMPATTLPWHYMPIWLTISTPFVYTILFLFGMFKTLQKLLGNSFALWKNHDELQDLIFLGLFISPILAVIFLKSTLYDGWRQMYFLYPAFILVGIKGWSSIWQIHSSNRAYRIALSTIMLLALSNTAVWMVSAHPFQNVYFNTLAGKNWKTRFEVDYWGLSNRQALEYILNHDTRPLIKVWPGSGTPLANSLWMLKHADRMRLSVVNQEADTDYIITNYRGSMIDYATSAKGYKLEHQIFVGDEVILSIFKNDPLN